MYIFEFDVNHLVIPWDILLACPVLENITSVVTFRKQTTPLDST